MAEDIIPPDHPDLIEDAVDEISEEENLQIFLEGEEVFERKELSLKEKLLAIAIAIFSFFLFLFLIFPYEELVRVVVSKISAENQILIDFKNLNLPFFGSKTVDGFLYQGKDGTEVSAESIETNVSYLTLLDKNFKGNIEVVLLKLDLNELGVEFKKLYINNSDIEGFDKPLNLMNFHIQLQASNGIIKRSPSIPMIETLKDATIKSFFLDIKKEKSALKVKIEKFKLSTSLGEITAKGSIELSEVFKASRLDLEICPTLDSKYSAEREDIANNLQLMMKDKKCFQLEGTISAPKPNLPGLKELQGNGNTTTSPSIPPTAPAEAPAPPMKP
jgi:hypothetical protein